MESLRPFRFFFVSWLDPCFLWCLSWVTCMDAANLVICRVRVPQLCWLLWFFGADFSGSQKKFSYEKQHCPTNATSSGKKTSEAFFFFFGGFFLRDIWLGNRIMLWLGLKQLGKHFRQKMEIGQHKKGLLAWKGSEKKLFKTTIRLRMVINLIS